MSFKFQTFVDDVLKRNDVWFVTNWQAIQWMRRPVPNKELHKFTPWSCKKQIDPSEVACSIPNVCKLHSRVFQQDRYFHTCSTCPPKYPWIRNEFGLD